MSTSLDYLDHLTNESARFLAALQSVAPDAAVPTCPDWDANDLLWHLAEVQWFWGTIVREKLLDPSRAEDLKPERPADRSGLEAFYSQTSRDLADILAATASSAHVWTWSTDQTVGFVKRRQAHEALIHRVDAEIVSGDRTPMDSALSSNGVDEVLRVMYGGAPPWGSFSPRSPAPVRLRATDTGDSWLVTLGRFAGTDPDTNSTYEDEPDIRVADVDEGQPAGATISALAVDLNCWLWHRPTIGAVERSGDEALLSEFDATIDAGIS